MQVVQYLQNNKFCRNRKNYQNTIIKIKERWKLVVPWLVNIKENEGKMQGLVIENISNLYKIQVNEYIYEAVARGKIKKRK